MEGITPHHFNTNTITERQNLATSTTMTEDLNTPFPDERE
jgi:hypothetical protein